MRKLLVAVLLLLISHSVIAQFGPLKNLSLEEETQLMEHNSICAYRNLYNKKQRLAFYPFNKTNRISIISFDNPVFEISGEIPVKNGILDKSLVKEKRNLSDTEINNLTDLLYNYGYRSKKYGVLISKGACYDPHNAILFFNEKGKVIEYIEICFDCLGQRTSSRKIKTGENCIEKFALLRGFFSSLGIKAGTATFKISD
ncbi:hypothetical protein [Pedobacter nototheniae]|uniref:hypothetical protein n=1 Tax=Pedobacter nototheniae TaxID=2488994 RepID=UPI00103F57CB|nr:hypothetical protein [Pedobacter nototheniae]